MNDGEKYEIIYALRVIKGICMSYRISTEIDGDPCLRCPFCADEVGNCFFRNGYRSPEEWKINEESYWRAFNE